MLGPAIVFIDFVERLAMITAPRPIRTSVLKLLPALVIVGVVCAGSVWVCNALVDSRPRVAVTTVLPEPVTTGSISVESTPPVRASAQALEAPMLAPASLADLDSRGLAELIAAGGPEPVPSTLSTKRTKTDLAAPR
jgi:hypothetical protein